MEKKSYLNSLETLILKRQKNDKKKEKEKGLRKQLFLLALRRWGRFARNNVCDSATEIQLGET